MRIRRQKWISLLLVFTFLVGCFGVGGSYPAVSYAGGNNTVFIADRAEVTAGESVAMSVYAPTQTNANFEITLCTAEGDYYADNGEKVSTSGTTDEQGKAQPKIAIPAEVTAGNYQLELQFPDDSKYYTGIKVNAAEPAVQSDQDSSITDSDKTGNKLTGNMAVQSETDANIHVTIRVEGPDYIILPETVVEVPDGASNADALRAAGLEVTESGGMINAIDGVKGQSYWSLNPWIDGFEDGDSVVYAGNGSSSLAQISLPEQVNAGENFTVTVTKNGGSTVSGAEVIYYQEGQHRTPTKTGIKTDSSGQATLSIAEPGAYYVAAESSDIVRTKAQEVQVVAQTTQQPDLIVTGITVPADLAVGSPASVQVLVNNSGTADAENFEVALYAGEQLLDTQLVTALAAGASSDLTFTWTPESVGEVILKAVADSSNAVNESDETNNELTKTVALLPWTKVDWDGESGLPKAIWGSSSDNIWAALHGGKVLHYDGKTWTMDKVSSSALIDIWGSSADDIWSVGRSGTILHYDGSAWTPVDSSVDKQLNGVWGSSANDIWAVGSSGTILHYDGSAWTPVDSGTDELLNKVWGSSADDIWAVGNSGTILHYNGNNWTPVDSGIDKILWGVWGNSADDVWAVGGSGTILQYDGSAWTPVDSGTDNTLQCVWGSSADDIWAVGSSGTILHYNGNNWTLVNSGTYTDLYGIWGSSSSDVWTAGGYSLTILHYGTGNGEPIEPKNTLTIETDPDYDLANLKVGNKPVLKAIVTDSDGNEVTGQEINWTVSDEELAMVKPIKKDPSKFKLVTLAKGTVTVTASLAENPAVKSEVTATIEDNIKHVFIRVEGYDHTIIERTPLDVPLIDLSPYLGEATGGSASESSGWSVDKFDGPTNAHAILKVMMDNDFRPFKQGEDQDGPGLYDFQDYGWSLYIAMIDGDREFDHSGMSGWMYRVNGEMPGVGCNDMLLNDGDDIVWYYGAFGFDNAYTELKVDQTEVSAGEDVTLTATGDNGGFASDVKPLKDATVLVNGEEYLIDGQVVKTDGEGKATISFTEPGEYQVSLIRFKYNSAIDEDCIDIVRPVPVTITVTPQAAVWSEEISGTSQDLNAIWSRSASDVWTVGSSGTVLHYDGKSWVPVESGTTKELNGIWGSSASDIWAVGDSGTILYYNGSAWAKVESGTDHNLKGVWGSSASDLWAVGNQGTILHYNGSSWTQVESGITQNFNNIWGSSASDIWAVGDSGIILHYNGSAWTKVESGTEYFLTDIWGSSASDLWATGAKETPMHYDGSKWVPADSTTNYLNGLWGSSARDLWAVGDRGAILHYDGKSWTPAVSGTTRNLKDIYGSSDGHLWAVGYSGTILHYGTGMQDTDTEAPVITTDLEDKTVTERELTFTASAIDDVDGEVAVTVKVNGETATEVDGKYTVKLNDGANTIVLEAEDSAGNKVTESFTITLTATQQFEVKVQNTPEYFNLGKDADVTAEATNNSDQVQDVLLIIALYDDQNMMLNYSYSAKNVAPNTTEKLTSGFRIPMEGNYQVKAFVWENWGSIKPLSNVSVIPVQ